MLHGNGNNCVRQWRHLSLILGQSAESTLDRVLNPLTPTTVIIIIILTRSCNNIIIIIIITARGPRGTQHGGSSPELDLVEQLHVRNAVSAIAGRINEGINHTGRPTHDRSKDMHKRHLDLLVKHIGEHEGQEAEQETQEDRQHHSG